MCGRFVQKTPLGDIRVLFETTNPVPNAAARYNAAPTDNLAVVRYNPQARGRALDLLRWGLVPLWAKDLAFGPKCINARSETIATNNIFKDAFERRRCLIPNDGFYEWKRLGGKATQPYAIRPQEDLFAFAGLWERWRGPHGKDVESAALLTTEANDTVRPVHDRMPVILAPADHERWLDPSVQKPGALQPLLRPYPAEEMTGYPVTLWVNSPQHDDPRCVEPPPGG